MAELTAYEKKRQEEYEKFVRDRRKNKRKDVPTVSPGAKKLARSEMRDRIIQKAMDAQKVAEEKMYANIPNYPYEKLMTLEDPSGNMALKSYYRNNPDFDTDFPPKEGTVARRIWDKEDAKRREDRKKKLQQEAVREADERLDVPSQEQAAMGPLSNVRTRKFDPDDIRPQGGVFNFVDYDALIDKEKGIAEIEKLQRNINKQVGEQNTIESRTTDNMGALDDRSSDQIKEGLLSNIATRQSRRSNDFGNFPETTSKQYEQRIKSQVGLSEEIEKAQRAAMGRGTQSEINRQRALTAPEVEDGEFAEKNRMEGLYQEDLKPTNKKARLEEITINATDIAEQLDEEGITDPEERKAVKEQVGNYFRDTSTNQLINLDRLQAEFQKQEDREDMFKTAQLLVGKPRQNFMIRNGLVDPMDIPELTEDEKKLEGLEKELKLEDTQYKIAELVVKREKLGKKFTDEQKAWVDIGKEALKDGDIDAAKAAFKEAGLENIPNFKVNKEEAAKQFMKLNGGQIDMLPYIGVADKDGKNIASFMGKYWEERSKVSSAMSVLKYGNPGGMLVDQKTKMLPYFNNAGVPMWEKLPGVEKDGTLRSNQPVTDLSFITDSSLRKSMEAVKPKNGFTNETEYLSAVNDLVFNRALDQRFNNFHSKYEGIVGRKGLRESGKDIGTGGKGAGSVPSESVPSESVPSGSVESKNYQRRGNPLEATGFLESNLPKNVASKNENVESRSNVYGNKEFFEDLGIGTNRGGGNPKRARARGLNVENIAEDSEDQNTASGLQAAELNLSELGPPISEMILKDPLNEQFTFGNFTDGKRGIDNINAYFRTLKFEGKFKPNADQEFFEKKKGERKRPVLSNGKPVYHIGHGIRLPLNKKEVQVLRINGFKGNPNEFLKAPTRAHAKKLQGDKYSITENQAEALMKHRYANHIRTLIKSNDKFAKKEEDKIQWPGLPTQLREVLFDMSYNIGPEFLTRENDPFENLRASIIEYQNDPSPENIQAMIYHIEDSKYYKQQVQNRASKNIENLRSLIK